MAGDVSRANGRRSKGPRSPTGKARVRMNALRHGLAARLLKQTGPTAETLALAADFAGRWAAYPSVMQAALPLAAAEQALAAVARERHRVLRREIDKQHANALIRSGLVESTSLLPPPHDADTAQAGVDFLMTLAASGIREPALAPGLQAWVSGARELQRLERYHRQASARHERARRDLAEAIDRAEKDKGGWPTLKPAPDRTGLGAQDDRTPVGDAEPREAPGAPSRRKVS